MSPRKVDERQGGVALGLSEYTSRYCRLRLVEACVRGIDRELSEKHDNHDNPLSQVDPRTRAPSILAGVLGVSTRTVQRWLSRDVQSCNVNAEKLTKVGLRYASEETRKLLEEDLRRHGEAFRNLLKEDSQ